MKTFIAEVMINQELEPVEVQGETIIKASEKLRNRYGISAYIASIEEVLDPDEFTGEIIAGDSDREEKEEEVKEVE